MRAAVRGYRAAMATGAPRGGVPTGRAAPGLGAPGILLGVGLGGFVDGILLHQVLQWHHLVSHTERWPTTTVRGLEINVLADGLFHLGALAAVVAGLVLLWRAARRSAARRPPRVLAGWILVGWGLFNLVEGVVNHHVLDIHNVRDDVDTAWPWNVGFLALSAVLVLTGRRLTRVRGARHSG